MSKGTPAAKTSRAKVLEGTTATAEARIKEAIACDACCAKAAILSVENRFVTKGEINLKQLIINTVLVYFSVISGHFIINQFDVTTKPLMEAPVFADGPGF